MGASGNPAKKAAAKKTAISSAKDFKKRKQAIKLELPSGLIIGARRVELRSFLKTGDVPNSLIPVVEEALTKGRNVDVDELTGLGDSKLNLDAVEEMYQMVDTLVIACCVEPKVHPAPEEGDEEDRDDDLLYIDDFDDEDKMFLFQWCTGGTADLATFRAETEASLVALAEGKGNQRIS